MDTLFYYFLFLAVINNIRVKLCAQNALESSCTNSMFVVILNVFRTMVVCYNELVGCLIELRGYILIAFHLLGI